MKPERITRLPRYRVISDNDYAGDPDGLFQLAHLLLSPALQTLGVIGSDFHGAEHFGHEGNAAQASATAAIEIRDLCHRAEVPVVAGFSQPLDLDNPDSLDCPATRMIIEAALTESELPLFLLCGGGLTSIAAAWLLEPKIAERLTLVWIGGPEHQGLAVPPPNPDPMEYNLSIDLVAAQVVFNESNLKIWQIPRDCYRQVNVGLAEIDTKVRVHGRLGEVLADSLESMASLASKGLGLNLGETYILGDSPLVLVTALQSNFHPDASSSPSVLIPRPQIDNAGSYAQNTEHSLRVFTSLDNRLMLEDMFAKLRLSAEK